MQQYSMGFGPLGLPLNPYFTKEKVTYYGGIAGVIVLVLVFLVWIGRF